MLVRELIRDKFGLSYLADDLEVINKLAGKHLAMNSFYDDMRWFGGQRAIYLLSRYFLPVADLAELTVGIHLLPTYIAQERFAVAQFDPESDRLLDFAHSIRAYIHRELLNAEDEDENVDEDIRVAREIFGNDFYRDDSNSLSTGYVEEAMINAYGGAAADYRDLAFAAKLRKSPEQADWLERGAETMPECMYFHCELAQLYAQQGETVAAAQSLARSLDCYHHTSYGLCSEAYYALGNKLLKQVPSAFCDLNRLDLTLADSKSRMEWIVSLFQKGEVEKTIKLMADFRYDSRTELHPVSFEFLKRHYEELGWTWALAWCNLCAVDENYQNQQYWYRGQPLCADWDHPMRLVLGLHGR